MLSPAGDTAPAGAYPWEPSLMTHDRHQTEQALINAVGQILSRDGFDELGVNAIAREAGVDKVLIYRYFDGLQELLRAFGERGDFWPSVEEVMGEDEDAVRSLSIDERMERIVIGLFDALRQRPETVEILACEVLQRNALTRVLEEIRERWSERVIEVIIPDAAADDRDRVALANLLIAGMNYLLIRSRHITVYGTLELHTPAGVERIREAVRRACRGALAPRDEDVRGTPDSRQLEEQSS